MSNMGAWYTKRAGEGYYLTDPPKLGNDHPKIGDTMTDDKGELVFEAADFLDPNSTSVGSMRTIYEAAAKTAAACANKRFKAWLDAQPVVESAGDKNWTEPTLGAFGKLKARLVCVEPAVADSAESLLREFVERRGHHGSFLDDLYLRARSLLKENK